MTALALRPLSLCLPVVGCSPLQTVGGDLAGAAARSVFDAFTSWVAGGAGWLILHVLGLLAAPTSVRVTSGWFAAHYRVMAGIGGLSVLPLLFVATIGAVLRQDLRRLGRAWGICLPVALLGAAAAVAVTARGLAITDQLSTMVLGDVGRSVPDSLQTVARLLGSSPSATSAPGFVIGAASLLVVVGGMLLWLELILRASAIYVALAFMPLALAGLVWPATSGWAKRLVETLFALVVAKFVIVTVLSLAIGALDSGSGIDGVVTGASLLLLAAFAPVAVLRLVPVVEAGAVAHLEGLARRPLAAATSVPSLPPAQLVLAGLSRLGGAVDSQLGALSADGVPMASGGHLGPEGPSVTDHREQPTGPPRPGAAPSTPPGSDVVTPAPRSADPDRGPSDG